MTRFVGVDDLGWPLYDDYKAPREGVEWGELFGAGVWDPEAWGLPSTCPKTPAIERAITGER